MSRRTWTGAEIGRARAMKEAGMSYTVIGERLNRTPVSVRQQFWRRHIRLPPARPPPRPFTSEEITAAAACLAFELAAARAERDTAPLLRTWPEGLWT